jgi:hypothetical protein
VNNSPGEVTVWLHSGTRVAGQSPKAGTNRGKATLQFGAAKLARDEATWEADSVLVSLEEVELMTTGLRPT